MWGEERGVPLDSRRLFSGWQVKEKEGRKGGFHSLPLSP